MQTIQPGKEIHFPGGFRFRAAWGGLMEVRPRDYLASPLDGSEVYRIARREFRETYRPVRG